MYYNTKGGARIRELRIAKNFTQDDLAEHMNVSHGYISFIESGKRGCSADVRIALSNLFGVSIDYIVSRHRHIYRAGFRCAESRYSGVDRTA